MLTRRAALFSLARSRARSLSLLSLSLSLSHTHTPVTRCQATMFSTTYTAGVEVGCLLVAAVARERERESE